MAAIEGKDTVIRALRGDQWEMIGCATSFSFNCETELITKTSPGSAGYRQYAARLTDWGFSFSGVTHAVNGNNYTVFDLLTELRRKHGIDIAAEFMDRDGNLKFITGHVLIPSIGIDSPIVGFTEDSIEFQGSGPFEIITTVVTPPPLIETDVKDPIRYTAAGGEMSLTYSELIDRQILYVGRDGDGKDVITAGTPNDKEVKYISSTGQIVFATGTPPDIVGTPLNPDERILILYK